MENNLTILTTGDFNKIVQLTWQYYIEGATDWRKKGRMHDRCEEIERKLKEHFITHEMIDKQKFNAAHFPESNENMITEIFPEEDDRLIDESWEDIAVDL